MGRPAIDRTGKVFGLLTVLQRDMSKPIGNGKEAYWICRCECGQQTSVRGTHLARNDISSCGCREGRYKHGMKGTPEYRSWENIRHRCNNPNNPAYPRYGGRGITIDPRYDDFSNFYQDIGPKPGPRYSVDRTNNEGNYEPGNIRWSTPKEQANNRRKRKTGYKRTHNHPQKD